MNAVSMFLIMNPFEIKSKLLNLKIQVHRIEIIK